MYQFLATHMDCPPPRLPGIERWLRRIVRSTKARHLRRRRVKLLATLDARTLYDIGASDIFVTYEASQLAMHNPYVLAAEIVTSWTR